MFFTFWKVSYPLWLSQWSHGWIFASDGHNCVAEGQMLTSLFFLKPAEKGNKKHKGEKKGVTYWHTLSHTEKAFYVRILNMCQGHVQWKSSKASGVATRERGGNTGIDQITGIPLASHSDSHCMYHVGLFWGHHVYNPPDQWDTFWLVSDSVSKHVAPNMLLQEVLKLDCCSVPESILELSPSVDCLRVGFVSTTDRTHLNWNAANPKHFLIFDIKSFYKYMLAKGNSF